LFKYTSERSSGLGTGHRTEDFVLFCQAKTSPLLEELPQKYCSIFYNGRKVCKVNRFGSELQHTNCYMFRAPPVHLQGAHSCTEQLLNILCM